jgi:hypothetical protein
MRMVLCRTGTAGENHQKASDSPMAEAVAFLISALTSHQNVLGESSADQRILASVSGKVCEALSALDYLSVTQWIRSGSSSIVSATPEY